MLAFRLAHPLPLCPDLPQACVPSLTHPHVSAELPRLGVWRFSHQSPLILPFYLYLWTRKCGCRVHSCVRVDRMLTLVIPKCHPPCRPAWAGGWGLLSSIIKGSPVRTDCSSVFHPRSPCWRRQGTAREAVLGPGQRVHEFKALSGEQVSPGQPAEAPRTSPKGTRHDR